MRLHIVGSAACIVPKDGLVDLLVIDEGSRQGVRRRDARFDCIFKHIAQKPQYRLEHFVGTESRNLIVKTRIILVVCFEIAVERAGFHAVQQVMND